MSEEVIINFGFKKINKVRKVDVLFVFDGIKGKMVDVEMTLTIFKVDVGINENVIQDCNNKRI